MRAEAFMARSIVAEHRPALFTVANVTTGVPVHSTYIIGIGV
jgi:hypothetical protein